MATNPAPEKKQLDSFNCSSESRRRKRTVFNREQVNILTKYFEKNCYPGIEEREQLSSLINIPESRIQVWFQNKRTRQSTQPKKQGSEAFTSSRKRMCLENLSPSPILEDNISEQEHVILNILSCCPSWAGEPSQEAGQRNGCSFERRSSASTTEAACLNEEGISQSHPFFSSEAMRPLNELHSSQLPRPVSQGNSSQWEPSWAPKGTQGPENYGSCTSFYGGVKPPLHQQQQKWTMGQLHPSYDAMPFQYAEELLHHHQQQHPTSHVQQLTPYPHQSQQEFQGQTQLAPLVREEERPNELFPSFKQQELYPIDLFKRTAGLESTLFPPDEHLKAPLGDLAAPQEYLATPLGDLTDLLGDLAAPLENLPEIPDASSTYLMFLDALSFMLNDES